MISTLSLWEDGPQKCFYLGARLIEKQARQANEIKFIKERRSMKDIFKAHRSSLESHLDKWVRNLNHENIIMITFFYVYTGSSGSSDLVREANMHEIYPSLLWLITRGRRGGGHLGLPACDTSILQRGLLSSLISNETWTELSTKNEDNFWSSLLVEFLFLFLFFVFCPVAIDPKYYAEIFRE